MQSVLFPSLMLPIQQAAAVTLDNVAPVVVSTRPVAGSAAVSPKTTQIEVTFSKTMGNNSWSWVRVSKDSFPELTGKPRYLKDVRTCVLPVTLKANHTYAVWLNTQKFNGFRDHKGHKAIPYLLVFRTAAR